MILSNCNDIYCNICGFELNSKEYPINCLKCNNIIYSNPIPVSATLIEVNTDKGCGLIIQRRKISPKKGEWALPGGYLVSGESWQEGSVREVEEEVGVKLSKNDISLYDVKSSNTNTIVIFSKVNYPISIKDINFKENEEVSEISIIYNPITLAFTTHTEVIKQYFY